MDQAMYAIDQQIVWGNTEEFPSVLLVMGDFHISVNFLAALGSIFGPVGWHNILTNAGVLTESVAEGVI